MSSARDKEQAEIEELTSRLERVPVPRGALPAVSRLRPRSLLLLLGARGGPGARRERIRTYRRLRAWGLFDPADYARRYPDVAETGVEPLLHYLLHGAAEGRQAYVWVERVGRGEPDSELAVAAEPTPADRDLSVPTVEETDQSDFTILLARQRSGTGALRSILTTHPEVHCFGEVFNLPDADDPDPELSEPNFFTFLERYSAGEIRRIFPHRAEALFLDYLEYLRALSPKPKIVIDVKYNEMHFLTRVWATELGSPFLFELIRRHNLKVVNLTRSNYLRYWLSAAKALDSLVYQSEEPVADRSITLDVEGTVAIMEKCRREDAAVTTELATCPAVLRVEYAELFPRGDARIDPQELQRIDDFLGVARTVDTDSKNRKQSSLPLADTIENYEEVAARLRTSEFASFLEDEPAYRPVSEDVEASGEGAESRDPLREAIEGIALHRGTPAVAEWITQARPPWARASLSQADAAFLFASALEHGSSRSIEIGVAAGYSSAVIAAALEVKAAAGGLDAGWRLTSYDEIPHLFYDPQRSIGEVARTILPPDLLERIDFRAPGLALDARHEHRPDEVGFAFIDGEHGHPWPTLDLLALVDVLRPGAVVVLHDVNLPTACPGKDAAGAKYLFDGLDVEKELCAHEPPNIGRIVIPEGKDDLRRQLVGILDAHPWQRDVTERVLEALLPATDRDRTS